jgi:hypothetical protein
MRWNAYVSMEGFSNTADRGAPPRAASTASW